NTNPSSVLAEFLTAGLSANCMSWATAPAGTELEQVTLEWLRRLLGFPDGFHGVIQDTASSATLVATIAGRDAAWERAGRDAALTFYASAEAHSSVGKAARLAGFRPERVRLIPADEHYALRVDLLAESLHADRAAGLVPAVVVATVGTTSSTGIDAVRPIGELCRQVGAFLHVDAAWAGSAAICPEFRGMLDGLELADSVVVNPHKWLGVQFDCSAHYVRDPAALQRSFAMSPEYLKSAHDAEVVNYRDWGIPLGRRFRALKLWMVLRTEGAEALRAMIREHIRLGELFASWIDAEPGWDRLAPAPLALVCFRHRPAGMEDGPALDAHNRALLERVNATGQVHMVHTTLRGRFTLRLAIGQRTTTERHVVKVWKILRRAAASARE
ncbi:MAG TPA: pyridoxal-dependent decarboxylase, partial [Gemmatimonadales bacterium]